MLENLRKALEVATRKVHCLSANVIRTETPEAWAKFDRACREASALREKIRRLEMERIIEIANEVAA